MLKHTNTHTHTHTHTYTHTCFQVSRYTTSSYSGIDRTEDDAWAFNLGVVRGSDQRTTICFSSPIAEEEQTPSENGRRSLSQGACSSSHTHTHTMWRRSVCKRADSKLGALQMYTSTCTRNTSLSTYCTCGVAVSASALTLDWALLIANFNKHTHSQHISLHTAHVASSVCERADSELGALHCKCIQAQHVSLYILHMWRRNVCKRADSKLGALHCKCIQAHALTTHLSLHTAHVTLQCL